MEDKTITNTPIDPNPEELYRSLKRDYQSLQTEADELRTREARLEEELEGFRVRESQLREQLEAFRVRETQLQEEIVALRTREAGMKEELEKFRACETQLKEELEKFRAHESQLKEEVIKSQNRAEMIEGYNELMIQMLSKRKEWLLVIDVSTKEIMYCNKKKQEERVDSAFCSACKKRLPFHSEIVKWDSEEQYKVWEMAGEADTYYRITSFPRVVSESNCTEKKIADSVYQIWRKSGQRNSVPDIVAEFINRGHDFKTSLMAGF